MSSYLELAVLPLVAFGVDQIITGITYPIWTSFVGAGADGNGNWSLVSALNAGSSAAIAALLTYALQSYIPFLSVNIPTIWQLALVVVPTFYGLSAALYGTLSGVFGDMAGSVLVAISTAVGELLVKYFF